MEQDLPTPRDDSDRKVLRDVAESGCHIVAVLSDKGNPTFAYSIGLYHNYRHPEILLFGLNHTLMGNLINDMSDSIQQGKSFAPYSSHSSIVKGFDCEFRPVHPAHYRELLGYALWFYSNDDFPAVQCVWPDKQGRFPWHADFDPKLKALQPTHEEANQ